MNPELIKVIPIQFQEEENDTIMTNTTNLEYSNF